MTFPAPIQHFDEHLFRLVNQVWANNFFDMILPPVRDKYFWIPLYILVAILLVWRFKRTGLYMILLLGVNFAASDQLSSAVIKPWVQRDRPCNDENLKDDVVLRVDRCGVGKSFTSSHATNTFAFAMMLTLLLRKKHRWVAPVSMAWAFLISYAQVYVGVHFPLDIIGGMLLGMLISVILFYLSRKFIFSRVGWEY